jgi:hypothetical protein
MRMRMRLRMRMRMFMLAWSWLQLVFGLGSPGRGRLSGFNPVLRALLGLHVEGVTDLKSITTVQ